MRARTLFLLCSILCVGVAASAQSAEAATVAPVVVSADTEWTTAGSPIEVLEPLTISPGATLTIDPGVVVKFFNNPFGEAAIEVNGTLNAGSTSDSSTVVFTSIADDSVGGDTNGDGTATDPEQNRWGAIQFAGTDATSTLEHIRFRYAGVAGDANSTLLSVQSSGGYVGNVYVLTGARVLIADSVFENVPGYQVYMGSQGLLDLENDLFQGENYIARLWTSSSPSPTTLLMHQSSIDGLRGAALDYYLGTFSVHMENNWWGDASGPYWAALNPNGLVNVGFNEPTMVSVLPFLACDSFASGCGAPKVSSVLFLPGIEGSRLYTRDTLLGNEHQLWEPTLSTDLPPLALNADGSSKAQIYTKDIVDSIQAHNRSASTIAGLFDTLEVYGTFEQFMDGLVATGTIKEWRAYPYDWRYDVFDIVQNGTLTEQPDGSITRVYLADVLKQMASNSATGKVTIVAHSNGGLLAKALAITLGADAPKYIDRIIMIGTPQYGTPSSIGALLHADNFADIPSLIINQTAARAVASTMPGAFGLLPAPAYFARIADPVATFDATSLAGKYAESYGATTTNYSALANFLSDPAHLDATVGDPGALTTPLALSPTLLQKAQATHAQLDAWTPPSGIAVTAIAGWGQKTLKTLAYTTGTKYSCDSVSGVFSCGVRQVLEHAPVNTQDGDDTVIDASALGDTAGKAYFDTSAFFHATRKNIVHQNLTAASPIQNIVESILEGKNSLGSFISSTRPPGGLNPITIISTRSPVNIVATDASGNRTGILPMPGTDFTGLLEDVPGSSVQTFGDEEYLYLPAGGSYTISMQAYAGGYATLNVGAEQADGSASTTVSFRNIPLIASTTATFSVSNGTVGAVSVDEDGNGSSDFTYTPGAPVLSPTQLIAYLRSYINTLGAAQGVKTDLSKALDKVEANLGSKKEVLRGALSNLQSLINAQSGKQITQAQALFMLQLVGLLSP
ncbi:hypothetical protein HY091_01770 [Candidatus Kaiserbacteria bacterium]|nr:hypothetical protein [Candidatus Kaiserbacteria bacterium]